jgi:hypothetical protein
MADQWIAPRQHQNGNSDHNYHGRKNKQGHSSNDSFHAGKEPMGARAVGTSAAGIRLLLFLIAFLFQASWSHVDSGGDT